MKLFYRKKGYRNERNFVVPILANCFRQHKSFFAEGRLKEDVAKTQSLDNTQTGQALRGISKKHAAFSLVEMLMALLVASLLLAALAPVMTKKINEKVNFEGLVPNPTRKKLYI